MTPQMAMTTRRLYRQTTDCIIALVQRLEDAGWPAEAQEMMGIVDEAWAAWMERWGAHVDIPEMHRRIP